MSNAVTITSATEEGQTDAIVCRICKRQFAKYTCPTCNVPYCSLSCFRSPAHNQCSESFYKNELEANIRSGTSRTSLERQQMLDLLKRFEEEDASNQLFGEEEEEDVGQSDLVERLESIDLDSLPPDQLWSMLTVKEKERFLKAFDDPTSQLAQQILSSEHLEKEIKEPWWEAPTIEGQGEISEGRCGSRPRAMAIPTSLIKPVLTKRPLVYNMSAICIAYAYTTRHLGVSPLGSLKPESPEFREARRLVSQLVPFLTERQSTQIYTDLLSVVTAVWSLLEPGKMTSGLISLLLRDAACLLRPLRVMPVMASEDSGTILSNHPHIMSVLVLSDLNDLFSNNHAPTKRIHIVHKLRFYTAHLLSTQSMVLQSLADEMVTMAREEDNISKETLNGTGTKRKSHDHW